MKITAAEVNKLRKSTGAGMMDCKKALVEAEGDFDKAVENPKEAEQILSNAGIKLDSEGNAIIFTAKDIDSGKMGSPVEIRMSKDLSAFMDSALSMLDGQVKEVYKGLSDFKESLNKYYSSKGPEKEENLGEATASLETLNIKFKKATGQGDEQVSMSLEENKNKSKKDLDKLIQEVILNKNK